MKMVIMLVGAVVLLLGSAGGAYMFFATPAEASTTDADKEMAEAAEKEEKKQKEAKKDDHGEVTHYAYVEMDPLILPILDKNGVSQIISLVVSLETMDEHNAGKIEEMSPKLKDAYIQDLYGVLSEKAALKGGVIQVGYIKERLNKISDEVMHDKDIVSDVLLQVVQQRPI